MCLLEGCLKFDTTCEKASYIQKPVILECYIICDYIHLFYLIYRLTLNIWLPYTCNLGLLCLLKYGLYG